jgi:hypothetical protein
VGQGLGDTQRAALTILADAGDGYGVWINDLADQLGLSPRRCRALVDSLRERELIWTRLKGWKGENGAVAERLSLVILGDPPSGLFGSDRWGRGSRVKGRH